MHRQFFLPKTCIEIKEKNEIGWLLQRAPGSWVGGG